MAFLTTPNLPRHRVTLVAVSVEAVQSIAWLTHHGIQVVPIAPDPRLAFPVCSHADMLVHHMGNQNIINASQSKTTIQFLEREGFSLCSPDKSLSETYPGDILLNALRLGNYLIGKLTALDPVSYTHLDVYKRQEHTILYISGEESVRQIKLRADRLGVHCANLYVVSETNVDVITATIEQSRPDIVMIDSIQTMNLHQLPSSPGSVSQVRECTSRLLSVAKSLEIPTTMCIRDRNRGKCDRRSGAYYF